MRATLFLLCLSVSVLGCAPAWDTEVIGYPEVSAGMPPNDNSPPVWTYTIIRIVNGDQKTRLFYDNKTRFVDTGNASKIEWDFDRAYRVRGKKDWIDPNVSRDGPLRILAVPDTTGKLWAYRVERLSEQETQRLIDSGQVISRRKPPDRPAVNKRPADIENSYSQLPMEERERRFRVASLRELADDVKKRIRVIESGRGGLVEGSETKDSQDGADSVEHELARWRSYLEQLESQIQTFERGSYKAE